MRRETSRNFGGIDQYTKLYLKGNASFDYFHDSSIDAFSSNITAYFPLNEETIGGVRNNLVVGNSNFLDSGSTGSTNGINGKAVNFTGGTNLSLTDSSILKNTTNLTISFWFRTSDITQSSRLFCRGSSSSDRSILIQLLGYKLIVAVFQSNGVDVDVSSTDLSSNTIYHCCVTVDTTSSNVIKMYINGGNPFTGAFDGTIRAYNSTLPMYLGSDYSGNYYNGWIDELAIWNTALSQTAVVSLYNGGVGKFTNSSIDPSKVTTITDSSMFGPYTVVNNNNAPIKTDIYKNNGSSIYFNGSANSIDWGKSAIQFGNQNSVIAIDLWVYWNADSDCYVVNIGPSYDIGSFTCGYTYNYGLNMERFTGSGSTSTQVRIRTDWHPTLNTWTHLAFVWNSDATASFYVNGIALGLHSAITTTGSDAWGTSKYQFQVNSNGTYFNGYLSDLRISEGTDRGWNTPYLQIDSSPVVDKTVIFHLPMNGVNGGTSFTDTSLYDMTITNNGVTHSTVQSRFGGSSGYFNGTAKLTVTKFKNFVFGINDFAIEMWFYPLNSGGDQMLFEMSKGTNADRFSIQLYNHQIYFYISDNGSTRVNFTHAANLIQDGNWYHLVILRNYLSNFINMFINGTFVGGSIGNFNFIDYLNPVVIGANARGSGYYSGYITDFFIANGSNNGLNGSLVYIPVPTSFLPSYQRDLLAYTQLFCAGYGTNGANYIADRSIYCHPIVNQNVAISTSQGKFNNSSMYFNGGNSYLIVNSANDFWTPNTTSFYISFWIYMTSAPNYQAMFGQNSDANNYWALQYRTTSAYLGWFFYWYDAGTMRVACYEGVNGQTLNTWAHIAIVRNGSTFSIYRNGIRICTGTNANSIPTMNGALTIGADTQNSYFMNGYASDIVLLLGTSLGYTGAETTIAVPTKPFSLDGVPQRPYTLQQYDGIANGIDKNTKLYLPLSDSSNTFTDKSFYSRTITNTNVTSNASVIKFGGSSAYFNGSNSVLYFANDSFFNLSGNIWMIGLWVYPTRTPSDQDCILTIDDSTSHSGSHYAIDMTVNSSGNFLPFVSNGSTEYYTVSSLTNIVNGWHYLVVSMNVGSLNFYVDGIRFYNTIISGNVNWNTNMKLSIGARNGGTTLPFQGYMSDLLLINGSDNNWTGSTIPVPTKPAEIPFTISKKLFSSSIIANPSLYIKGYSTTNNNTIIYDSSPYARNVTNNNVVTRTTNQKYGPSSMYFNGSSSFLSMAQSSALDLTGDFAISFWFYPNALGYNAILFPQNDVSGAYFSIYFSDNSNNKRWYVTNGGYSPNLAIAYDDSTLNLTTWCHVAVVKSNNVVYLFRDGVQKTSASWTGTATNVNGWYIGRAWNAAGYLNGYLSELTIVNGSSLGYTGSAIPVPTGSLNFS